MDGRAALDVLQQDGWDLSIFLLETLVLHATYLPSSLPAGTSFYLGRSVRSADALDDAWDVCLRLWVCSVVPKLCPFRV